MKLPSDADASGRDFDDQELALLKEVINSGTLNCTKGTQVNTLEKEIAEIYGIAEVRAVSSGTAACHTAYAAIDPEPCDEIIGTPVTDMGAIAPMLYQGAIPIFADVDPVTLNITPESVAERITERTRAIVATHLFGNPCDMAGIQEVAARHGIPVIEDCAQAFLSECNGRLVGTIGDIGCFSLQQGKHMTTGEGGFVMTNNEAYARRMRLFSDKAWGYGDPNPDHYFLALNYRLTELQGAVARAQLAKLRGVVSRRQATAAAFTSLLEDLPGLTLPSAATGSTHVYWKYPLIVDPNVLGGADGFGAALKERGVWCAPRYIQKPAFMCQLFTERNTFGKSGWPYTARKAAGLDEVTYDEAEYPGTRQGLARVVVLPWNEQYTDEHVGFIAGAVREVTEQLSSRGAGLSGAGSEAAG